MEADKRGPYDALLNENSRAAPPPLPVKQEGRKQDPGNWFPSNDPSSHLIGQNGFT